MAHSREAHAKMPGMGKFNEGHWEKKKDQLKVAGDKYTPTEMGNGEELEKANNALASYAKSHKAKH